MKYKLLIVCLFSSVALFAQSYTRSWRTCTDNPTPSLTASAIDSSDNVYIAGYQYLLGDPLHDTVYLKKYSPAGKLLWEIHEPYTATTAWELRVPITIATDGSGDVVLSYSFSFVQSNLDAVVNKYNKAGKRLWQTVFDGPADIDNEQVKKLNIDSKGNIYLLVAENYNYATIAYFGSGGKLKWYRDMTGIVVDGTPTDYQVKDATIDSSGNVYATGFSARLHNGFYHDAVTYKFFANGDSAWRVRYGVNYVDNFGYKVMYAKADNSLLMCGYTERQGADSILAIKYTVGGGKLLWSYTRSSTGYGVFGGSVIDADNNILLVTDYASEPAPPPVLSKLSASGSLLWMKDAFKVTSTPAPVYEILDVKTDAQSNYYCISNQLESVLTQKFDKAGNLLAQVKEGVDSFVQVNYYNVSYAAVYVGKNQSIYTPVSYDYNYGPGNRCVYKYTLKNTLIAADDALYSNQIAAVSPSGNQYSVYPNPAHDIIHIQARAENTSHYTTQIFDALGKQVATRQYSGSQSSVDIHALTRGVYMMKIIVDSKESVYKFIKQ